MNRRAGGTNGTWAVFTAVTDKPLCRYQGSPKICQCPADQGDLLYERYFPKKCTNAYAQYGTSYRMEWSADFVRVKRVTGNLAAPRTEYAGNSIKSSEIALRAANKVVIGDWPWHPNSGFTDKKSIWHNDKRRSLSILAFGDGHSEAFKFPALKEADLFWNEKPDPSFTWGDLGRATAFGADLPGIPDDPPVELVRLRDSFLPHLGTDDLFLPWNQPRIANPLSHCRFDDTLPSLRLTP